MDRASFPSIQDEIDYLTGQSFLYDIDYDDVETNLFIAKCWGDTFWRRRGLYGRRGDPEIKYLSEEQLDQQFDSVLEVGTGYGRVTKQLAQLPNIKKIVGIEICTHFEEFANKYLADLLISKNIFIIYEDIFTSYQVEMETYDLIIIPMNTIPLFSRDELSELFRRLHSLMNVNGKIVFSTYPNNMSKTHEKHVGELLVELGDTTLAIEQYSLETEHYFWGMKLITYGKYTYLGEDSCKTKVFRTLRHIMDYDAIEHIIEDNDLRVAGRVRENTSSVWILEKV